MSNRYDFSDDELDPRTVREPEEFCDDCGDVVTDHTPSCPRRNDVEWKGIPIRWCGDSTLKRPWRVQFTPNIFGAYRDLEEASDAIDLFFDGSKK